MNWPVNFAGYPYQGPGMGPLGPCGPLGQYGPGSVPPPPAVNPQWYPTSSGSLPPIQAQQEPKKKRARKLRTIENADAELQGCPVQRTTKWDRWYWGSPKPKWLNPHYRQQQHQQLAQDRYESMCRHYQEWCDELEKKRVSS